MLDRFSESCLSSMIASYLRSFSFDNRLCCFRSAAPSQAAHRQPTNRMRECSSQAPINRGSARPARADQAPNRILYENNIKVSWQGQTPGETGQKQRLSPFYDRRYVFLFCMRRPVASGRNHLYRLSPWAPNHQFKAISPR